MASEETAVSKTSAELRAERVTWFALVGLLILAGIIPDWLALHNAIVPLCAGLVLIGSGMVQYRQKWRVSFSTWVAGTLMLIMAIYSLVDRPDLDFSFVVIVLVAIVIAIGVFTNET